MYETGLDAAKNKNKAPTANTIWGPPSWQFEE